MVPRALITHSVNQAARRSPSCPQKNTRKVLFKGSASISLQSRCFTQFRSQSKKCYFAQDETSVICLFTYMAIANCSWSQIIVVLRAHSQLRQRHISSSAPRLSLSDPLTWLFSMTFYFFFCASRRALWRCRRVRVGDFSSTVLLLFFLRLAFIKRFVPPRPQTYCTRL